MKAFIEPKPASIALIGWMFIVFAILLILSGAMGFLVVGLIKTMPEILEEMPNDLLGYLNSMPMIFQNLEFLSILQIAFAVIILVTSTYFLKFRTWARTGLEVICWCGLVASAGFSVLMIFGTIETMSASAECRTLPVSGFILIVLNIVLTVLFAFPIILIIRSLRGKTMRQAFEKQ